MTLRCMPSSEYEKLIEEHRRLRAEAESLCAEIRQKIEHLEWVVDVIHRERRPDFFQPLQDAIRSMHGFHSRHVASFAVRKVCGGQVLWLGMVEEFALVDATGTVGCYAWQYGQDGRSRTFTLLKQGDITSPQAAVQLFLLAKNALPAGFPA